MASPRESSFGALLSVQASSRNVRKLRHISQTQRAMLTPHVQQLLQQWKSQWGMEPATAIHDCEVHCHAFAAPVASSVLAAQSWKPLVPSGQPETVWWTLLTATSGAVHSVAGRPRPNGAVLLASLSQAMFGESVNLQQHGRSRMRAASSSVSDEKSSLAAPREEPAMHPEATLAVEIVFAAWADWCKRFAQLFGCHDTTAPLQASDHTVLTDADALATDALPAALLRSWSGAFYLSMPWYGNTLLLLLPGVLLDNFQQPSSSDASGIGGGPVQQGGLTPMWTALATQASAVEVKLAPLDIALGALTALQVGDVVRTSHALDQPLIVNLRPAPGITASDTPDAGKLCDGFLGSQAGHRAVELL